MFGADHIDECRTDACRRQATVVSLARLRAKCRLTVVNPR
jgi:hypothetical protein